MGSADRTDHLRADGPGHALRLEEDERRGPPPCFPHSAGRDGAGGGAAVHVRQGGRVPGGRLGGTCLQRSHGEGASCVQRVHPRAGLLARDLQPRGHLPGVRLPVPRQEPLRRQQGDTRSALVRGTPPGLPAHALDAPGTVTAPLRRVHRPPRHRRGVPRFHGARVDGGPRDLTRSRRVRRSTWASTTSRTRGLGWRST